MRDFRGFMEGFVCFQKLRKGSLTNMYLPFSGHCLGAGCIREEGWHCPCPHIKQKKNNKSVLSALIESSKISFFSWKFETLPWSALMWVFPRMAPFWELKPFSSEEVFCIGSLIIYSFFFFSSLLNWIFCSDVGPNEWLL